MNNALLILTTILLLQACGGGKLQDPAETTPGSNDPVSNPITDPTNNLVSDPASAETESHGLLMKISTDKSRYVPGEIVIVNASVENISGEAITWWTSCLGVPIISVSVNTRFKEERGLSHPDDPQACATAIGQGEIAPGEKRTREVYWDLTLDGDIPAPAGLFETAAYVSISDGAFNLIDTARTAVKIEVVSNMNYVEMLDAVKTAYELQSIQDWFTANKYEARCYLYPSSQIVFDEKGNATIQSSDFQGESSSTVPGCSARLIDGPIWRIGLFNKFGALPGDYGIDIDAQSGAVIDTSSSK